jgi:hypothetical protein
VNASRDEIKDELLGVRTAKKTGAEKKFKKKLAREMVL